MAHMQALHSAIASSGHANLRGAAGENQGGNLAEVERAVGQAKWDNLRFIEDDIRSPDDCRETCRSARYVLHQAALGSVPQSIEDPVAYHDTNVTGFLNMLVAARDAGVSRFVRAGSSAACGDDPGLPQIEPKIGCPLSPYGLTNRVVRGRAAPASAQCRGRRQGGKLLLTSCRYSRTQ